MTKSNLRGSIETSFAVFVDLRRNYFLRAFIEKFLRKSKQKGAFALLGRKRFIFANPLRRLRGFIEKYLPSQIHEGYF